MSSLYVPNVPNQTAYIDLAYHILSKSTAPAGMAWLMYINDLHVESIELQVFIMRKDS